MRQDEVTEGMQIRKRKGLEPEPQGPRLSAVWEARTPQPARQEKWIPSEGRGFLKDKGATCVNQVRPSETTCLSNGPGQEQFPRGVSGEWKQTCQGQ